LDKQEMNKNLFTSEVYVTNQKKHYLTTGIFFK